MKLQEYFSNFNPLCINNVISSIKEKKDFEGAGFIGSLRSLAAAKAFIEQKKSILFLATNIEEAEKVLNDLENLLGEDKVILFPEYDISPYELRAPHKRIIEDRLNVFEKLNSKKNVVIVSTLRAVLSKIISKEYYKSSRRIIKNKDVEDLEELTKYLVEIGYKRVDMVEDIGQFSIRGGILDVFSFLMENPCRIEFWDIEVESIRSFDIQNQKSIKILEEVLILPMRESGACNFAQDNPVLASVYSSTARDGIEWFTPYLEGGASTLFSYFKNGSLLFMDGLESVAGKSDELIRLYNSVYPGENFPIGEELVVSSEEFKKISSSLLKINLLSFAKDESYCADTLPEPEVNRGKLKYINEFKRLELEGNSITVFCENGGQARRLSSLLDDEGLNAKVVEGSLEEGFILKEEKQICFNESRLFDRYSKRIRFRKFKGGVAIHNISVLNKGDYVVHVDYGVGLFLGIERIVFGQMEKDCIKIKYKDGDTLSVPIEDIKKVQKYSSKEASAPPVGKLGGKAWAKVRDKVKKDLEKIIRELVDLYAKRKYFKRGYVYEQDTVLQKEFDDSFLYTLTVDQAKAVKDIKSDMTKDHPMDRLICGDVGFGKTEVALRAAFKAADAGKQVAVLVPTTVLAYQHYNSFKERFSEYPVNINFICRWNTPKKNKEIVEKLAKGQVDIIIGTHALLSEKIHFMDLGLLIIDEEHRFGVKQKERIRLMRSQVDTLTLTATPIPRTLQLSLMGGRDLSLIATPPLNRMPVQTRVVEKDMNLINSTILRETSRGGQVYFLHNRVQSIYAVAEQIRESVPGIIVEVGHGQMNANELENTMHAFVNGQIDVFVCTTIVESGLDISNANTMIIDHADHFGLAQLYQLRGRIGRSSRQAYAMLVVDSMSNITPEAKKRLMTLEQFSDLGSGFSIAMRDLEIRGAGNLLGEKQHGLISAVGFDLYQDFLKEAVEEIKENKKIRAKEPDIRVEVKAFIPEEYIPAYTQRLEIYQRLSSAVSQTEVDEMLVEVKDRFGVVPDEVIALFDLIRIKMAGRELELEVIAIFSTSFRIEFPKEPEVNAQKLGKIMSIVPQHAKLGYNKPISITIPINISDKINSLQATRNMLLKLL